MNEQLYALDLPIEKQFKYVDYIKNIFFKRSKNKLHTRLYYHLDFSIFCNLECLLGTLVGKTKVIYKKSIFYYRLKYKLWQF